jgi:uncharacterized protein YjbI with pentapeptide repeats
MAMLARFGQGLTGTRWSPELWEALEVPIILRRRTRQIRRDVMSRRDHSGENLSHAKLYDLDLHGKVFRGADLSRTELTACNFIGADLEGADLTAAILTGAQFGGANLRGANLTGTYALATEFDDARMDGAILDHMIYDYATTWPSYVRPPGPAR